MIGVLWEPVPGLRQTGLSQSVIPCGFPDWADLCLRLEDEEVGTFVGAEMGLYCPRDREDSSGENRNTLCSLFLLRMHSPLMQGWGQKVRSSRSAGDPGLPPPESRLDIQGLTLNFCRDWPAFAGSWRS